MIELRDVTSASAARWCWTGSTSTVQEGETVALLGPSGTGKSVLLKHIIGLIRPDAGVVIVDDRKSVTSSSGRSCRSSAPSIGYVFQNGALFDSMNVFENVRLGITDEDKYPGPRVLPGAGRGDCLRLVNLRARDDGEVPGRALGRHAEAGRASRAPSRAAPSTCCTTSPPRASTRSTPTSSTAW